LASEPPEEEEGNSGSEPERSAEYATELCTYGIERCAESAMELGTYGKLGEVRSRQWDLECMESERASERASAAAALREVWSHQWYSAHMEGWGEVRSRQWSSARMEWREVRSRQWNSARMKWPMNRHAGEASPARLLKIPAQKCVAEVGGKGVFGTADLMCCRSFAERRAASESELARHMPTAQQRSLRPQPTFVAIACRFATVGTAPKLTAT